MIISLACFSLRARWINLDSSWRKVSMSGMIPVPRAVAFSAGKMGDTGFCCSPCDSDSAEGDLGFDEEEDDAEDMEGELSWLEIFSLMSFFLDDDEDVD